MTSPRLRLVDPTAAGYYHCMSRFVRRAFLCGDDRVSGRSFEHRKDWIANRAVELVGIFAVGLYAYAVMSNHVHLVVYLDPPVVDHWSAAKVAERWLRLFPVRDNGEVDVDAVTCGHRHLDGRRTGCPLPDSPLQSVVVHALLVRAHRPPGETGGRLHRSLLGQVFAPAKPAFITSL